MNKKTVTFEIKITTNVSNIDKIKEIINRLSQLGTGYYTYHKNINEYLDDSPDEYYQEF